MRSLSQELRVYTSGNRRRPPLKYEPILVKTSRLLIDRFELSHCDAETQRFLEQARDFSVWKLFAADMLRCFVSRTTANGILGRGGMFVVSTEQACSLLRPEDTTSRGKDGDADGSDAHDIDREKNRPLRRPPLAQGRPTPTYTAARATPLSTDTQGGTNSGASLASPAQYADPMTSEEASAGAHPGENEGGGDMSLYTPPFDSLLDIGAGDGGVTEKMAQLFGKVYATEYSATMRWRLRRRGYEVLDHEDPFHDTLTGERRVFDVIACLNVLDRADTPLTLLREMRDSLKPESGLLMLAVVLPWCPFVEYNSQQRRPRELLPMQGGQCCKGASFEESLTKLVENVLEPVGFELVRWTKLPYLCEGNLRLEYALLHDAVMVLKRKPVESFTDTARLASAGDYD